MKKRVIMMISLGCLAGAASADTVSFILKPAVTASSINGSGANLAITMVTNGLDLVYTTTYSGVDLDGGGVGDDTLSWDTRLEAFEASSLSEVGANGQITVVGANKMQATADGTNGFIPLGGWRDDTLKFSIENVSLTADAGYTASFDGFTGMWLTSGDYYIGEGTGTFNLPVAANSTQSFAAQDTLLITTWNGTDRNRDLQGSFTVIPEPATLGLVAAFGGGILFVRRILQV